ncbi:MnhB domain-containing protein [Rubritalea tangerina]|uniref:MnhB domain-containing protein n=1 Tax=Rubritalea tangerina TaxID=430798 RepID=A0ABW4Z5Y8_9BACT
MDSVILRAATRLLYPLLIILSLVVLYRGHNLPGGGFIGGLIAASAVMLRALAVGWDGIRASAYLKPLGLMHYGLIIASASALLGLVVKQVLFEALWLPTWYLPVLGKVKLGTPITFDIGVYMVVLGFALQCAKSLDSNNN